MDSSSKAELGNARSERLQHPSTSRFHKLADGIQSAFELLRIKDKIPALPLGHICFCCLHMIRGSLDVAGNQIGRLTGCEDHESTENRSRDRHWKIASLCQGKMQS